MTNKGKIVIISGPSGCGKSTVLAEVFKKLSNYYFSVSATTRKPREGETDGVDYLFISKNRFKKMLERNEFLEHAEYVGNYYGTPIAPIYDNSEAGNTVILDIEINGFRQIKEKLPEAISIFIAPPSLEELERRLRRRGTESEEKIIERMNTASEQLKCAELYDHVVINDEVCRAADEILDIINSEKKRGN